MVENANRFNKLPTTCSYLVNHAANLPMFRDSQLDFIYTSIVLQHMRPWLAEGYLREFARVLAPGGVLVFQMPDHENFPAVAPLRRSLRLRTTARRVLSTFGLVQRPYRSETNCVPEPRLRKLTRRSTSFMPACRTDTSSARPRAHGPVGQQSSFNMVLWAAGSTARLDFMKAAILQPAM